MQGISWVAEDLLASQEGLWSIESYDKGFQGLNYFGLPSFPNEEDQHFVYHCVCVCVCVCARVLLSFKYPKLLYKPDIDVILGSQMICGNRAPKNNIAFIKRFLR
jgi:hypothetical protein